MDFSFDFDDVVNYTKSVATAQQKAEQKELYKFLRQEGTKLKRKTTAAARSSGIDTAHEKSATYKNSAHYIKTIKRGKAYTDDGVQKIRVYSSAPHAHLLEYGHKIVGHKPKKVSSGKSTTAYKPFETGLKNFEPTFYSDLEKYYAGGFSALWK